MSYEQSATMTDEQIDMMKAATKVQALADKLTHSYRNAPPFTMSTDAEISAAVEHLNALRENAEAIVHFYCMMTLAAAMRLELGCKGAAHPELVAKLHKASLDEYDHLTIEV